MLGLSVSAFNLCGHRRSDQNILTIKSQSDLNPKNLSVIVVGDVLNNQECRDEKGYSGSDKKRHEATPDISSVHGNRPNEKVKSDRQANDRRVEEADVGKSVFVGIAPVLDWRHEAPGPEGEHDRGGNREHDAQPG